jgi:hypothetical protein
MKRAPDAMWWNYRPEQGIEEVVREAAAYYEQKRGETPSLCLVRVCAFEELPPDVDGIRVEEHASLTPFHVAVA